MFAGIDSESVLSAEPSPPPRLSRSKSAVVQPNRSSSSHHHHRHRSNQFQNPFLDPNEISRRDTIREEEFGWSGSPSGIRGRDDRQIERDAEYERKMEERTRKRHERKLARQQARQQLDQSQLPTPAPQKCPKPSALSSPPPYPTAANTGSTSTHPTQRKKPAFVSPEPDSEQLSPISPTQVVDDGTNHAREGHASSDRNNPFNLGRGKSLRDKVGAALGRFNSMTRSKSISRSKSVGALDHPLPASSSNHQPARNEDHARQPAERKEGLIRRLSRKITIEDQERRRKEREQFMYAEPPLLSHTLVGPDSPFPMRPALSSLVPTENLKYGEAHTDYSPNPYRRRRNLSESHRFRVTAAAQQSSDKPKV